MISFQKLERDKRNGYCNAQVVLDGTPFELMIETGYRVAFIPGGDFFFYDAFTCRVVKPSRENLRVVGAKSTLNDTARKVEDAIFAYEEEHQQIL